MVEGGLKPGPADLAIAVFLALITRIANVTGMPYVLFPELGALGWVIFSDRRHPWARSPALLMLTPFLAGGGGGRGGSGGEAAVPSVGAAGAGGAIGTA